MLNIPSEVKSVIWKLKKAQKEAYIVGGCVRDILRQKKPQDWDIATNAKPGQIEKIFPKSFSNNKFGTVTVITGSSDPRLKHIEITPYRIEQKYSDKRHPDKIRWAQTINQDLGRRDFTINAMAMKLETKKPQKKKVSVTIVDPFSGQKDLKNKTIKAVGDPQKRFSEDALRLMRAVRFATTLGFKLEKETAQAVKEKSGLLRFISKERIREELMKIVMSDHPAVGIELLRKLKLLRFIIPELEEGYGVAQNKHHIYGCYEHALLSLKYAAQKDYNKYVRLAALLHDIAKPRVKQGEGPQATFYNHEVVGAKMTIKILQRLRFSKKDIEKIAKLVRYHLFYYNVGEVGESSVRRLVRRVGPENMEELLEVRMCDRIGSGCPKAEPYKLRHLRYLIEKVSRDPLSVKMLKVSGEEVMEILEIEPGPKVGQVLDILLSHVLEDPQKNNKKFLKKEIEKLSKIPHQELKHLAQKARREREELEMKRDQMSKEKYWVS